MAIAATTFAIRTGCGSADPAIGPIGDGGGATNRGVDAPTGGAAGVSAPVFVIAMENRDAEEIYGNVEDAPYINATLMPRYAHATAFRDALPDLPSEPHYLLMEAGTNAFFDHVFTDNHNPSSDNSTAETEHLVTQIAAAGGGLDWRSYQQGINHATGGCPIEADGFYRPRHNPFVFFRDVAGDPPSKDNAACAARHRDVSTLAADLASGDVAAYNFVTPDLCNDMHGSKGCAGTNAIRAGDDWLAHTLPAVIAFVNAHGGVIFITWEEGHRTAALPFLAVGPGVKPGYAGAVPYDHKSVLKTVEELLGLPTLAAVAGASDLGDLFLP